MSNYKISVSFNLMTHICTQVLLVFYAENFLHIQSQEHLESSMCLYKLKIHSGFALYEDFDISISLDFQQ